MIYLFIFGSTTHEPWGAELKESLAFVHLQCWAWGERLVQLLARRLTYKPRRKKINKPRRKINFHAWSLTRPQGPGFDPQAGSCSQRRRPQGQDVVFFYFFIFIFLVQSRSWGDSCSCQPTSQHPGSWGYSFFLLILFLCLVQFRSYSFFPLLVQFLIRPGPGGAEIFFLF
jgi:hypothetical protein